MDSERNSKPGRADGAFVFKASFLKHVNHPFKQAALEAPDGKATGIGKCGDSVGVEICVKESIVTDIHLNPHGCIYTVACTSALATLVKGKTIEAVLKVQPEDIERELGGLPEDHRHCAVLAVNTLGEAVEDYYCRVWGRGADSCCSGADEAPGKQNGTVK